MHRAAGEGQSYQIRLFEDWDLAELQRQALAFVEKSGLENYQRHFLRGSQLAQNPEHPFGDGELNDDERKCLRLDGAEGLFDKFKQPAQLYFLVICCSLGAAVQGHDESAIAGGGVPRTYTVVVLSDSFGSSNPSLYNQPLQRHE